MNFEEVSFDHRPRKLMEKNNLLVNLLQICREKVSHFPYKLIKTFFFVFVNFQEKEM